MEITKISSKGQIVIPSKIREKLGIVEGSMLVIEEMNNGIIMKKVDNDLVNQIKRSLEDIKHGRIKEWKG
jgi:AbrB family looped-hinge helix DNA binding protein